jgi:HTH-type transcriptional regulator/antitoxin HigA
VIDDAGEEKESDLETEADRLAASWIQPHEMPKVPARVGHEWVNAVARNNGVHPIVVIGQLQNAGKLNWRSALVKAAPSVTEYLQTWNHGSS